MAATIAFEVKSREQKKKKNSHQDSRWLPYVDYLNETKQKYRKSATAGATRELNSFTTRSARCVRQTQNTIHIIVSCMHSQFTFTGSNMQTTGRWVDNVTPLFLSLSMAFQSKLQYMFFYRRRNLRPRWSTTKVHASQLPYFDHKKKKRVYRSQKRNITPLEIQHKIHSTFYFLSTVPLKATYHTPSSSCAFAMRKFHSHLPNPKQTADHHSEDETKQSQTTNNNPQNKPKKHMIDAVCM